MMAPDDSSYPRPLWLPAPRPVAKTIIISAVAAMVFCGLFALSEPVLAVSAAVATIVGLVVLAAPDLATYLAVFIVYSNVAVVAVRFHGAPKIIGSAVVLLLAVPIIHALVFRRQRLVIHPVLLLLLLWLAVQVLGMLFTKYLEPAKATVLELSLEGVLIYFLITNAVRTPKALRGATWALLLGGFVMAAVPIYQQFTQTFDNDFGGFGQMNEIGFRTGEVTSQGETRQRRLSGPIGAQNRFAQNLLMLIPVGLILFRSERSSAHKLVALTLTASAGLGCILAFSRGAAVAFVLLVAVMVGMRLVSRRTLALLALGAVLVTVAMPQYMARLATLQSIPKFLMRDQSVEVDGAVKGRLTEMLAAAHVFLDHPLIGAGPGTFQYHSLQYGNRLGIRKLEGSRQAHCLYLEIAAESGILGLACFASVVFVTLHGLYRARMRWAAERPELANMATAYLLAVVAYLATALFLHMSYVRFFYLILGLAGAATCVAGVHTTAVMEPAARPPAPAAGEGEGDGHG